jgi:hypothetical protein
MIELIFIKLREIVKRHPVKILLAVFLFTLSQLFDSYSLMDEKITTIGTSNEWKYYASMIGFSIKMSFSIIILIVIFSLTVFKSRITAKVN